MCEPGQCASYVRDFVTPAEGGEEFDALVDLICVEAEADARDRRSGAACNGPTVAHVRVDFVGPVDSPLSTPLAPLLGADPESTEPTESTESTEATTSTPAVRTDATGRSSRVRPRLSPLIRNALVGASLCTKRPARHDAAAGYGSRRAKPVKG